MNRREFATDGDLNCIHNYRGRVYIYICNISCCNAWNILHDNNNEISIKTYNKANRAKAINSGEW